MKKNAFAQITLLFLMTVLFSCSEEETTPTVPVVNDPNYTLNKPKDQVYPYEILSVEVSGLSDLKTEYDGKFGSLSIKLAKGTGNTLVFLVPDINEGKQTLELSLNSNKKTLDFTVLKLPDLGNPETVLAGILTAAKAQLTAMGQNPGLSGMVAKQQEWVTLYEQEIAKLNAKEKLETVGVLKVNNLLKVLSADASGRYSWACTAESGELYLKYLSQITFDQGMIDKLVQAPSNPVSKAAAITAALNLRANFVQLKEQALKVTDCKVLRSIGIDESGARVLAGLNDTPVKFESGKALAVKIYGGYQSLNQGDKTSSIALLSQLATGIEKMGEQLDKAIVAITALKTRFSLSQANLEAGDKIQLAANPEKEVKLVSNPIAKVEKISIDQVILKEIAGVTEGASLNFESKKGGDQAFTFDLLIEDGPLKVKKTINASINLACTLAVTVNTSGSTATVQTTGGLAPFTYTWSNNGTGTSQSGLSPGNYNVKVKDALGCEVTKEFTIQEEAVVGTVTDVDGNQYATIKIGTQVWMAENLKTTKFADGTEIPNVTANAQWMVQTTAALSYYNNDISNKQKYGILYNWYAATCCAICPQGWHLPTQEEWEKMRAFLLPNSGVKLKSTTGWRESEIAGTQGTNESGFNALPGGVRGSNGNFFSVSEFGHWWMNKSTNATSAPYIILSFNQSIVSQANFNPKWNGASIRCVKD